MPKELHEISQFVTGTVTTASERDIPDDAASSSLNIDPVSESGVLQGVPEDDNVSYISNSELGENTDYTVNATSMAIINNSGERDLIYFDSSDTKIKKVTKVNSGDPASGQASALSSTAESNSITPTMQVNNKEVHIGMGSAEADKPLWAGHIKNSQFGTSYSGLQLADAELADPSAFPNIYQFIEIGNFIYGIEWQGQYIYKFTNSSPPEFVNKSNQIFSKTQGISARANGGMWILEVVGSSTNVHVCDDFEMISEFSVDITHNVKYSDILEIGSYLYFNIYSDSSTTAGILKNEPIADLVAGASTQTPATITPYSGSTGVPNAVTEYLSANDLSASTINTRFISGKTCLMDIGNTDYIGWGVTVQDEAGSSNNIFFRPSSGIIQVRTVVFGVKYNAASQAKTEGTNSKIYTLETSNDYLSNFSNSMFSITAKQSGRIIISHGSTTAVTSSVNDGVMVDFDSASTGTNIDMSSATTLQLSNACVFNISNKVIGFSGSGSGQMLRGNSIGNLTEVLETNVNLNFSSSNIDYGYGGSVWTSGARTGFESSGYSYFYKVSFLYDGYQETSLSDEFKVDNSIFAESDGRPIDIEIQLKNLGSFNKRISHVNLYRAHSNSDSDFSEPEGFYRLVDSYELNTSFSSVSASSPFTNYRQKKVRDINVSGASYEARTGLSEVLTNITPNYAISTQLNNQLFIGNTYQKDLGAYSNYIYKSKPYNFDQFNYIEDFLALPTTPTALANFNGRIYAFDENNMYQIEPNNLYIEDIIEGKGCFSQHSVFVNDYGMCFADKNNIYLHNGKTPIAIGDSILRGDTFSWENKNSSYTPIITFDSFRNSFVIFFRISSSYYSWCYNLLRKRWDLWKFHASNIPQATAIGKEGEMLVSNGTNLVHYVGHASNKRAWDWKSKKLNMRQNTGDKSFKKLEIIGTPTGSLNNSSTGVYAYKDADAQLSMTSITGLTDINLNNTRSKHIQIQFTGQTSSVDAIGTVFRRHILLSKS